MNIQSNQCLNSSKGHPMTQNIEAICTCADGWTSLKKYAWFPANLPLQRKRKRSFVQGILLQCPEGSCWNPGWEQHRRRDALPWWLLRMPWHPDNRYRRESYNETGEGYSIQAYWLPLKMTQSRQQFTWIVTLGSIDFLFFLLHANNNDFLRLLLQ